MNRTEQQRTGSYRYAGPPLGPLVVGFLGTVGVGLAMLAYWVFVHVGNLPLWIVLALFIALGLSPIVERLQKFGLPRPLAVLALFITALAVLAGMFWLLIPAALNQLTLFASRIPDIIAAISSQQWFQEIDSQFGVHLKLEQLGQKIGEDATASGGLVNQALTATAALTQGLFGTLIVLVLSTYFLASLPQIKAWVATLVPASKRERYLELSERITASVGSYMLGQATVALLNALFALVVMLIVGVPYPWPLACAVAALAFVPLVGPPSALVLVSLIALTQGWPTALWFAVPYMVYLQVEAYVISPRVMQRAVSVPGPLVVISVIAGGTLLGVLGAVIAIPVAASLMILVNEVFVPRQQRR